MRSSRPRIQRRSPRRRARWAAPPKPPARRRAPAPSLAKAADMRELRPLDRAADGDESLWHERIIEPETRQLAARAAEAAGLPLEKWIERAIRRSCALDGMP